MARRFRFFARRDTDPGHPTDGIERQRRLRHQRSLLGLHVDPSRRELQGSLVASVGCGRWRRFEPKGAQVWRIPDPLVDAFPLERPSLERPSVERSSDGRAHDNPSVDVRLSDAIGAAADLADWMADRAIELVNRSGDDDDDLLAVCVHDDGWRIPDFDGAPRYVPRVAAERLAERSGWPVIGQLRDADVAAGGRGDPLDPLPLWFLLADRSERTAESGRLVVRLGSRADLIYLPPSDGLDAEHPAIEQGRLDAWERALDGLGRVGIDARHHLGATAVQGRVRGELDDWFSAVDASRSERSRTRYEQAAGAAGVSVPDMARTAIGWLVERTAAFASRRRDEAAPLDRILLVGEAGSDGLLQQLLRQRLPSVRIEALETSTPWRSETLDGTIAALLGFLHVDQQPASLPWLTGADVPRLHGRLVPGHLASWRRLLVEMADFRPPPMRLRDAV